MNTCRLDLWGFGVDVAPRANRTLRINASTWELEDSFSLVTLAGNCFHGHQAGMDVSSMIFCPPRVNPSSQSDVTFLLYQFSMLPVRPAIRSGRGRFFNRPGRLRLENDNFRWQIVEFT